MKGFHQREKLEENVMMGNRSPPAARYGTFPFINRYYVWNFSKNNADVFEYQREEK